MASAKTPKQKVKKKSKQEAALETRQAEFAVRRAAREERVEAAAARAEFGDEDAVVVRALHATHLGCQRRRL
eukprot:SAG11_NODE_612_length_8206_cov_4.251110_6_plen_72_part_00